MKLKYRKDARPSQRNCVLMEVDTKKLDELWRKNGLEYYIPRGKGGVLKSLEIVAPIIDVTSRDTVDFEDGRHRFAALRDMGFERVVVSVRPWDVEKVKKLLDGRVYEDNKITKVDVEDDYEGDVAICGALLLLGMITAMVYIIRYKEE